MGTGQVHKEVYEKKIWEQIEMITGLEEQGLWDHIDTSIIRHILLDSIKFYYGDTEEKAVDFGFLAAKKETKEVITDLFNHYNSKLKELTKPKLDRRDRTETVIELEAKVKLLIKLKKKLCQ